MTVKWNDLAITAPDRRRLDLVGAALDATVRTTVTGASTLTVHLPDSLLREQLPDAPTATAAGRDWSLVGIRRIADRALLVYEDALIAALRAHTDSIMWQGALAAADVVGRFCTEAAVPVSVDPTLGQRMVEGAGRSRLELTDSWREIGALVDRLGGRAFATREELVVSTDTALLEREAPIVRDARGAVQTGIDFTLDVAQPFDRATFTVDSTWTHDAGTTVDVRGAGPADGPWLVAEWRRPIATAENGWVRLTRPRTIGRP